MVLVSILWCCHLVLTTVKVIIDYWRKNLIGDVREDFGCRSAQKRSARKDSVIFVYLVAILQFSLLSAPQNCWPSMSFCLSWVIGSGTNPIKSNSNPNSWSLKCRSWFRSSYMKNHWRIILDHGFHMGALISGLVPLIQRGHQATRPPTSSRASVKPRSTRAARAP